MTKDTWKGAPADPGMLNRYSYTHGDPVNLYDPSGHYDSVTGGPEGVDVYNSVSAEPYRPVTSYGNSNMADHTSSVTSSGNKNENLKMASTYLSYAGLALSVVGLFTTAAWIGTAGLIIGGLSLAVLAASGEKDIGEYVLTIAGAVPLLGGVTGLGVRLGGALSHVAGVGRYGDIVGDYKSAFNQYGLVKTGMGKVDGGIGLGLGVYQNYRGR